MENTIYNPNDVIMPNYANITHNTIIECFDNYSKAYTDAKNLLEDVNEMIKNKAAEELGLYFYYIQIHNLLTDATRSQHDPKNLLPIIQSINQTYENNQTLPRDILILRFLDVHKEASRFADRISECLDNIDMAIRDSIKYNGMTATEEKHLPIVKTLKRLLSIIIREAGYEEIHVEIGKKMSDYDERLLTITDAPKRTSFDQLIIKEYDRGLRCKYIGKIKRVGLYLDREDIENSI